MSKNKKKLHWSETRKLKKIIRSFNREFNLEKLCLTKELVNKFKTIEKRLLWLFCVIIAIVFVLLVYFRHNQESFYWLSLLLVPIAAFLAYYYFYFIPKARKDKGYKDNNSFSYWATEEDYKKRLKKIAKKYSKKERKMLIKETELKVNSFSNLEFIGLVGLSLYFFEYLLPFKLILTLVLLSFITKIFIIDKLRSEKRATYTKFIEDLIWADYYDEN